MAKRIFSFFAAFLSLLGLYAGLSALMTGSLGVHSPVLSISGLLLPVFLVTSLLLIVYWLSIKSLWSIVPALTLLAGIPYLCSTVRFSSPQKAETANSFTLCTYNAQGFTYGETRLTIGLFAEFLNQNNVQILCLQEMDGSILPLSDSLFRERARLVYHSTTPGRRPGYVLAVYSAYPLDRVVDIPFPNTFNHALMTDVALGDDTIRLFNVHLQTTHYNQSKFKLDGEQWLWNSPDETQKTISLVQRLRHNTRLRQSQADTIASLIDASPYRVVACGDLNATPSSYTYWRLKKSLKDGFMSVGSGYEYTYRYLGNLFRIDYIFHHPELEGVSYGSYDLDYSDHKPVIMRLVHAKQAATIRPLKK